MNNEESANELFHFTKKYDSIKSIMIDKFKPFYCVEDFSYMYEEKRNQTLAYPMVCFCDIPFKRIAVHKCNYGYYGIGLTKRWEGVVNLNIVNYSFIESTKSASYRILIDYYLEKCDGLNDDLTQGIKNALSILLMTTKPYEGRTFDKDKGKWSERNIRFYNEREWRYLPLADKLSWSISLDEFAGDKKAFYEKIEKEQPEIQKQYPLKFTVDDITHIFLKYRSEKEKFLNDIRNSYSEADLNRIEEMIYIEED